MDNTLHFSCTILIHHAEDLCNPKQDNTSNRSLNCPCILYNTNVQGSSGHENIISRQDVCFHLTCSVLRHGLPKHVIQLVIHQINTAGHEERIADLAKGNQRIQKGKFTKTLQRVFNKVMKISMVKNSPRLTRSCYIQSSKSLKTGWALVCESSMIFISRTLRDLFRGLRRKSQLFKDHLEAAAISASKIPPKPRQKLRS